MSFIPGMTKLNFQDGHGQINFKTTINHQTRSKTFAFINFHKRAVVDCLFERVHILRSPQQQVFN